MSKTIKFDESIISSQDSRAFAENIEGEYRGKYKIVAPRYASLWFKCNDGTRPSTTKAKVFLIKGKTEIEIGCIEARDESYEVSKEEYYAHGGTFKRIVYRDSFKNGGKYILGPTNEDYTASVVKWLPDNDNTITIDEILDWIENHYKDTFANGGYEHLMSTYEKVKSAF